MNRFLTPALTAALALALAGCGGKQAAPLLPACAKAGPPVELPSKFPDSFPLPDGTRITLVQEAPAKVVIDGMVPQSVSATTAFLQRELPKAGYELSETEVEEDESESLYSGEDVSRGSWRVSYIPKCPDAVHLNVSASTD
jgi:hypothetical protein